MNSTYGLECQVHYLAEQVGRLNRILTDILERIPETQEVKG